MAANFWVRLPESETVAIEVFMLAPVPYPRHMDLMPEIREKTSVRCDGTGWDKMRAFATRVFLAAHGRNRMRAMAGRTGTFRESSAWGETLRFLALALLIPFLCNALVMPGTMPALNGQGQVTVILCGEDAPVQMALADDGSLAPRPAGDDERGAKPCIWSLHAQSLLVPEGTAVPADRTPDRQDFLRPISAAPVLAEVVPPQARGPPVIL